MPKLALPSPYRQHCTRWAGGCGAKICPKAARRCFVRGDLPCEVLFIGEGPGKSEDLTGLPFTGPAGHLLDDIVAKGFAEFPNVRKAFTNLVACIPLGDDGKKTEAPDPSDVKKCQPRLIELIRIAKPRLIVCVGDTAKRYITGEAMFGPVDWLPPEQGYVQFDDIIHPSAILKKPIAARGIVVRRCISRLQYAVKTMYNPPPF